MDQPLTSRGVRFFLFGYITGATVGALALFCVLLHEPHVLASSPDRQITAPWAAMGRGAAQNVTYGSYLICIGDMACSEATIQQCSVALGTDVQLPPGDTGSHVFVNEHGAVPLQMLDIARLMEINEYIRTFAEKSGHSEYNISLGLGFMKTWNEACAGAAVS